MPLGSLTCYLTTKSGNWRRTAGWKGASTNFVMTATDRVAVVMTSDSDKPSLPAAIVFQ
jgi:hypothetical protein